MNCLKKMIEQSQVFWVLCPNLMNLLWTLENEHAPEPFRELPEEVT